MGKQSMISLAGMVLAGAALAGCQNSGSSGYRDQPYGRGGTTASQNPNWNNRPNNLTGQGTATSALADNRRPPLNPGLRDAQPVGSNLSSTAPVAESQPVSPAGSGTDPMRPPWLTSTPTTGRMVAPSSAPVASEHLIKPPEVPQEMTTNPTPANVENMIIPKVPTHSEEASPSRVPDGPVKATANASPGEPAWNGGRGQETANIPAAMENAPRGRDGEFSEQPPFDPAPSAAEGMLRAPTDSDRSSSAPVSSRAPTPGSGPEMVQPFADRPVAALPALRDTSQHQTDGVPALPQ